MKKFRQFTGSILTVFSGATTGSLVITHTDNWKWYLSIVLLTLSLRSIITNTNADAIDFINKYFINKKS